MDSKIQLENQPIIKDDFIVKVKLLSNEVFEFIIEPDVTKVIDLKKMILDKIKIPLDKQRIIFSAKQLQDDCKITDIIKQSGLTVHLIARISGQQPTTTQTQSNTSNQQQTNNQTANTQNANTRSNTQQLPTNNPFESILRGFGVGGTISGFGGQGNQTATMTFTNMGDLGASLGGLLGNFGIHLPQQGPQNYPPPSQNPNSNPFQTPPTNPQRRNLTNNQPTTSFLANVSQQPTTNQTQNRPSVNTNAQWNVSNQPLLRLNQTISTLDLPSEPVYQNHQLNLREQTAAYLRRLQHQYMRMIPQLNRSIQLLNEGRITHLQQVLRLFEAINNANRHAQQAMRRLINLPTNQQQQNTNQGNENSQSVQQNANSQQQNISNNLVLEEVHIDIQNDIVNEQSRNLNNEQNNMSNDVQATIIIQGNQIDDSIDQEPTILPENRSNQTENRPTEPQLLGSIINIEGLPNLLQGLTGQRPSNGQSNQRGQQMFGGFNLNGIMNMLEGMRMPSNSNDSSRQNQTSNQLSVNQAQSVSNSSSVNQQSPQLSQQNQQNQQATGHVHGSGCNHQTSAQQQSSLSQFPQIDLNSMVSIMSNFCNSTQSTVQQTSSSTSQSNQQTAQQNPMGGLMNIFSSLQQQGGMGELLNTSLGETIEQGLSGPTIYSTILKSFTGSDILTCFTSKNFSFLDKKYENVRQNILVAISIAGSRQDLIQKLTNDISRLMVPNTSMANEEKCLKQVRTMLKGQISTIVNTTLNRNNLIYSQVVLQCLKRFFCQSIDKIIASVDTSRLTNGQSPTQFVFHSLKINSTQQMDRFIQGLSGMFYGFIERDLIRVYNEYKEQQKRKQQRSVEQIVSEEQLLKQIQIQSKKDINYLKDFKHSNLYHPKSS